MPNLDTVHFTSEAEIKAGYPVGDLVDVKYIQPAIRETSDCVRMILKSVLADAMRTIIYNGIPVLSVTQASPGVLTTTRPHGLSSGAEVAIIQTQGMPDLDGSYTATTTGATTLTLNLSTGGSPIPLDTSGYPVYAGGSARLLVVSPVRYGLIRLLQVYHSRCAIREMLLHHSARIVNSGIAQVGGFGSGGENNVRPIEMKALGPLIDAWASKIVTSEADIRYYLCEHSIDFPELTSSQNPHERSGPRRPRVRFL
jgi:hypothetical protein